jgi:hypothetical protein
VPSRAPTPATRVRAARIVALTADAVQLVAAPLFGEGFASPLNDALDLIVAAVLIKLLGFHWALLPAAAAEMVPALDLAPTWTASVFFITSTKARWWIALLWVAAAVAVVLIALALRRA